MTAEVIALTEELRTTTAMLSVVVDRLDAADKRATRHRLWTGVLACCVLANAVLFGLFWIDDRNDEVTACLRANAGRADIRASIAEAVRVAGGNSDQDRVDAVIAEIDKRLRDTLPDRDC